MHEAKARDARHNGIAQRIRAARAPDSAVFRGREGAVGRTAGFGTIYENTILPSQTTGTAASATTYTVNGAGQSGSSITVTATVGPLKKGDIVTFAGVNAVNRVNKNDIGTLRQFALTADVPSGSTVLPSATR